MKICNMNCFNCKFDDCINDELYYEDYINSEKLSKEIILERNNNNKNSEEYKKACLEANEIRIKEYRKKYYKDNKYKGYSKKYYEAHKDICKELSKKYYEAHKDKYEEYRRKYKKGK